MHPDFMGKTSPLALFGLSKLSVWWLCLGIDFERIKPGNPQQNGHMSGEEAVPAKSVTYVSELDTLIRIDCLLIDL